MSVPIGIALPTPFPVGPVNCWVLQGEPLTLVDTGPSTETAIAALEDGLAGLGHRLEDVELLILTHQHVDHVGNAALVAERSGCEVAAHRLLAAFVGDVAGAVDGEAAYQEAVMALHGLAPDRTATFFDAIRHRRDLWGPSLGVDRVLEDGDTIVAGSRPLRVAHRPGHSPTDTIFVDDENGKAVVGDHLLAHISSNPLVVRGVDGPVDPRRRRSSLVTYLDSLALTGAEELTVLHTGHGRQVTSHRALIAERRVLHEARVEQVAALLGAEPLAAAQLAEAMWPGIAVNQTYLTLCEVLGALDLLEAAGRVAVHDDGAVIRYTRTS